ncbi:MAG: ParB/RepB/Spo0J family partition protein [Planctomycetota bacterium]|jgi:ParB family chromosome partitioning protein
MTVPVGGGSDPLPHTPPAPSGPSGRGIAANAEDGSPLRQLEIDQLSPNPRQPRQHFDEAGLEALAASIAAEGMMQPVVARHAPGSADGDYQLIVGERRWRAARQAGLRKIPALVFDVDDQTAAQWSLVENLQREDLNPIERAEAFQRLIDEFGLTHQEIAERVGLDRSSITNHLRLNELDEFTKSAVIAGQLGFGHAKALLGVSDTKRRERLARQTIRQDWSVREVERRVGGVGRGQRPADAGPGRGGAPLARAHLDDVEQRLGQHLGTKVRIQPGRTKGSGKLVIEFFAHDQFEGLLERLGFAV